MFQILILLYIFYALSEKIVNLICLYFIDIKSVANLVFILFSFYEHELHINFGFGCLQSTKSDRPEEAGLQRGGELRDLQPEGDRPSQPGYACQRR